MEKQGKEGINGIQAPWVPGTPMKPYAPNLTPIHQNTAEQADRSEAEGRFYGENMAGLDQLSFGDLLALANNASVLFAGQEPWANGYNAAMEESSAAGVQEPTTRQSASEIEVGNMVYGEVIEKANATMESLSSVSNNIDNRASQLSEQMKTPEKPKRRKHRPKVVKEAKPKRDPKPQTPRVAAQKPVDGVEIKTPKRKYVRKKEVSKDPESTAARAGVESAATETVNLAKKLCRRALDFEDEDFKAENRSSSNVDAQREGLCNGETEPKSVENRLNSEAKFSDETETVAGEKQVVFASDLEHSGNQEPKDCFASACEQVPITPVPSKRKRNQSKQKDKTPNKNGSKEGFINLHAEGEAHLMAQTANSGNRFAKIKQGKELTSRNLATSGHINTCDIYRSKVQYNALCDYQKMHWLYFTNLQQEGMRSRDQNFVISSTSCAVSGVSPIVGPEETVPVLNCKCYSSTPQHTTNKLLTMEDKGKAVFQGGQSSVSSWDKFKDTPKKKQTTGHARFRDLASINKALEGTSPCRYPSEQIPALCYSRPQNYKVSLETSVTLNKDKRKTKSVKAQINQKTAFQNLRQFPASFPGISPDELWKQYLSVEAISEQMRLLDINRENSYYKYQEAALVPYAMKNKGNELALFRGAGPIVSSTPPKKRLPRPKVDLDNETDRVWKLLLENINSDGIDGTDEEKTKWWEEERRVFKGRADSFIARMHLVQGDRRFTPWKGSVVDSVVGVFLTQNVSDHLSSSAFMSLAAAFPAHPVPDTNFDAGTSSEPLIQMPYLDSEESISNPTVYHQSFVTLGNINPDEEKDSVNSDETSRGSSEITNISKAHMDSDKKDSSVEAEKTNQTFLIQDCVATQDLFPSEESALTSQSSVVTDAPQNTRAGSFSEINSEIQHDDSNHPTFFMKLLDAAGSSLQQGKGRDVTRADTILVQEIIHKNQQENLRQEVGVSSLQVSPKTSPGDCSSQENLIQGEMTKDFKSMKGQTRSDSNEPCCSYQQEGDVFTCEKTEMPESSSSVHPSSNAQHVRVNLTQTERSIPDITESTSVLDVQQEGRVNPSGQDSTFKELNSMDNTTLNSKGKKVLKEKKDEFDWDSLRREAEDRKGKRETTKRTMDSVDWETIRTVNVNDVAETIKSRGMNHKLAERIQDFLNRLLREHGSLDLEWLRDVPPDKAKEYLLSFRGLGLKSVECVRLLTLHHLAFPVDTNVGRIAVRLGWVPLQPLPESLQLHLLEMYPILESIQKYLWPRLCKLDQKTLYELHYQMITFGKVFCTKSKPNCNACPMRGECRHFASAFASARLALPGTDPKDNKTPDKNLLPLPLPEPLQREHDTKVLQLLSESLQREHGSEVIRHSQTGNRVNSCEPIIEEPTSPEPEPVQVFDIEDAVFEDPEEIPTIRLNLDALTTNLKNIMEHNKELQEGNMSNALVALTAEAASIPMPKLKNISQLRTEHQVYELPDSHPLLVGLEKREPDDPCSYLLAIWTPGETADSIQPAIGKCISQESGKLCEEETCFSCNSLREARSQTVRGTLLVPCRTAMRGSFPLNGTYFQVNEVFADHESSLNPIDVPREWLWDLHRRTVYFGTSIPSIFKGLTTETIQHCFWRGYVCVRGFDRKTRGPRPLIARLHFPASRMSKSQANAANPANPGKRKSG